MTPYPPQKTNTYLPPGSPRTAWWKLAGSTSLLGSLFSSAHAETVQITLTDNQISHSLGNTIDSDLTGDDTDDFFSTVTGIQTGSSIQQVRVHADTARGGSFSAAAFRSTVSYQAFIAPSLFTVDFSPRDLSALVPFAFTDARINGGAETNGLLEIRARNVARTNDQVSLVRLIFDDASTEEPTDAITGGTKPEWIAPPDTSTDTLVKIAKVKRTIKTARKKFTKAKRSGNRIRTFKLRQKLQKLRARLQEKKAAS